MNYNSNLIQNDNKYKVDFNSSDSKDWITVTRKGKNKNKITKKNKNKIEQNKLNDIISNYQKLLDNRQDFVYITLKKYQLCECNCKKILAQEIIKFKKIYELLINSRTIKFFEQKKKEISDSIFNMNKILNKNNWFILIGMGLIKDQNENLLKDLPEFNKELLLYEIYLKKKNENQNNNEKILKTTDTSFTKEGKSFVSLFKNN